MPGAQLLSVHHDYEWSDQLILPQEPEASNELFGPWKLNIATYPYLVLTLLKPDVDYI
jgi:hypothetical protein